jgi:hypothetical protein
LKHPAIPYATTSPDVKQNKGVAASVLVAIEKPESQFFHRVILVKFLPSGVTDDIMATTLDRNDSGWIFVQDL